MCLSTVYKNKMDPASIAMKNVMTIECRDGLVILTDLMERQVAIEGELEKANLVDGYVIVKETIPA
ncbi:MAG: CooT family nickel-binding protein [Oscillospiraceae bacterium]|nr:CooT family nickel-binding protein [Clostridiales bacterium]MCI7574432.1 CooT family nickel-binding protein [Clostridiales bacterium]MDD7673199.1 CooT family nickel-binding protein [Oscillospiraceae bacterium]MDY5641997.1 CooT family nickel-binding protein [Candidatus Faecousia sp.]